MHTDSKDGHLAVPHDVLGNAAQKHTGQPRAAVGSHYDQLAVQFQRGVHDHRAWRTFTNDSPSIRT